ncbi:uncharacterized protein K444DRAFT_88437 [Hyaloscypha bicolor E]|uniref:Uncharacterized protein n=1 Tax=Hyaloscypha bicolor E TaxID=1095630 RepID=A0A2J6SXD5_9HELO|nr:uncharacterized protein K444DRAFT_88437 [Hyaloscypha bicolor E]PMD55434.1 hypothetical protein K444DRAFT_88437 [Hyaloscypha bicolor E]
MSPTTFKDQYTTFLSTLNNSYDLCQIIRATRRFGSAPTPNFDAFQSYTLTSKQNLAYTFTSLRSACGSRFDLGDTIARTELDRAVRSLLAIQSKLSGIAYGHERTGGFQSLLYQLQTLEAEALSTFSGLKYRLEITQQHKEDPKPKSILKKSRTDEVVIGIAKLDAYTSHMKNSWVETEVDGEVFYVNVFDGKKKQWERPKDAFVMLLPRNEKPKAPKRTSTWEKESDYGW